MGRVWPKILQGPVGELLLVAVVGFLACLLAYVLPSIRLAEERRVNQEFDGRFRRTVEDLRRLEEQRKQSGMQSE